MQTSLKFDWTEFDAITDEQAYANALSDPDNPPISGGKIIDTTGVEGKTPLERFRNALAREKTRKRLSDNIEDGVANF